MFFDILENIESNLFYIILVSPEIIILLLIFAILKFMIMDGEKLYTKTNCESIIMYAIYLLILNIYIINKIVVWEFIEILFNNEYIVSNFTFLYKIILNLTVIFILFIFIDNLKINGRLVPELTILIVISIFGIYIIISSNNLLLIYLGMVMESLTGAIFRTIKKFSNKSAEAGIRYFTISAISTNLYILGVSVVYYVFGTVNILEITKSYYNITYIYTTIDLILLFIAFISITVSIYMKLGIYPFHNWLPFVYEGSPGIITCYLATVGKITPVVLGFKLITSFMYPISWFQGFVIILGVLTIVMGSIDAIYQLTIKSLIAYSSIVHSGYILLTLALCNNFSFVLRTYYIITYLLSSFTFFSIYLSIIKKKDNKYIYDITEFVILCKSWYNMGLLLSIGILSLAGVPLFPLFYAKLYLIKCLVYKDFVFIAFFILIFNIISSTYYIRLVRFIIFESKRKDLPIIEFKPLTERQKYLILFLIYCTIFFMFLQEPLFNYLIYLSIDYIEIMNNFEDLE